MLSLWLFSTGWQVWRIRLYPFFKIVPGKAQDWEKVRECGNLFLENCN
ncbi:MAG: hypothetical protein ABSB84_11700 [Verrucomicrobiota bacterium]|jgi:hypothetical protein